MLGRRNVQIALAMALLLPAAACRTGPRFEEREIWFEDLGAPLELNVEHDALLARYAAGLVLNTPPGEGRAMAPPTLPPAIAEDGQPRIVFLSVSDSRRPAMVVTGAGYGLPAAARDAAARWRRAWAEHKLAQPRWVKVDIVRRASRLARVEAELRFPVRRSLQGFAFDRSQGSAILPEESVARDLINREKALQIQNLEAFMKRPYVREGRLPRLESRSGFPMHSFETIAYFATAQEAHLLFRGHRLYDNPTPRQLFTAARLGGQYLVRATGPDGRFAYSYRPVTDKVAKSYNILRHAGTIYAMMEAYEVTGDSAVRAAAERAIDYLKLHIKPAPKTLGKGVCVVDNDQTKLGGNGLALLALCKHMQVTGDRGHLDLARQLAVWILSVQADSGEFQVHIMHYSRAYASPARSAYYPGEAILALLRLHALDPDGGWIDAAERAARWIAEVRDIDVPTAKLFHDQWILYSLNELCLYRARSSLVKHAMKLTGAIIATQELDPEQPDWLGSFYKPPRSTPTATRIEGLCAAHAMLGRIGGGEAQKRVGHTIRLAVSFLLQMQFLPENAMYFDDPQRIMGGFRQNLTVQETRIDYVQHAISAILAYRRILQHAQDDAE